MGQHPAGNGLKTHLQVARWHHDPDAVNVISIERGHGSTGVELLQIERREKVVSVEWLGFG
ncbi:MAG: hypothetical protein DVS81_00825 [Candidatus Accumulibacter meliphilus]|uniref:Uncharacterized protein n=1 Tax=Candidatus Accumulibacter meliphilus TaxID=2211374 RepID=A0A369XQC1_9PROT|nr:MAG: hypothetical protein DVS81_00825 [Candidatus Accumulibacter meliphilus]